MPPAYTSMTNSIETVPAQLRESLRQANVDNLLEYLSTKPEVRLGQNEQRGEPDLTATEKINILRTKYDSNPMIFLATFGRFLDSSHLECFSSMRKNSYEINFYLAQLEQSLSPSGRKKIAKNRRYEALQKLVDTTDYFTEEEMQRRNPILYEQLIGKYHTEKEREAFLFQSATTSSAVGSKSDSSYNSNARPTPLSDMLIAHMSRVDGSYSQRRLGQESQMNDEHIADEYSDVDENENMDEDDLNTNTSRRTQEDERDVEEIEDDEKELLKEEFFTTMYRNFLEGKDEEIDYATIDENPDYDCGETFEQDEEEKYFDADDEESNVDKCETMSQISNKEDASEPFNIIEDEPDAKPNETEENSITDPICDDNDEEDELDAYMKSIEKELTKQM